MNDHNPQSERDDPGKIGNVMLYLAWFGAIVILALVAQKYLNYLEHPNRGVQGLVRDDGVRELVLKRANDGHYYVDGKINGHTVTFLLDTGATSIAIPDKIARRISLKRGQAYMVNTANGRAISYSTTIQSLHIGPFQIKNIRAGISPTYKSSKALLGMSVLKKFRIIQQGETLTIQQ